MTTAYTFNHYEQRNINPNGRADWVVTREIVKNGNRTSENLELSLSKDTMRFFRNLGSKQEVKRSIKAGKEVVRIYSYCPNDRNLRTVHEFIEK